MLISYAFDLEERIIIGMVVKGGSYIMDGYMFSW